MRRLTMTRLAACALLALTAAGIAPATPLGAQQTPKVGLPAAYDGGFLVFQSADSSFRYWLDGRLQLDGAIYNGSKNALGSGSEVRRARLGGKMVMYRSWHGEVDIDFAKNAVEMKDMWLGYTG